jgi:ABC-type uncharacterized transport system ATPase component
MELIVSGFEKKYQGFDGEPDFLLQFSKTSFCLGEIIFIMGHNGSGKSLLTKLISGEISPLKGIVNINIDGKKWDAHDFPSTIVRQKADDGLAMDLTVKENLILRIKATSWLEKLFPLVKLESKIKKVLNFSTELSNKMNQPCRNLSGGQKQLLAFFGIVLQNLQIVFLDEFLSATDFSTRLYLRDLTKQYARELPACIFVVSHDIDMALADADRILVLKSGQVIRDINRSSSEWNVKSIVDLLQ